MIRAFILLLLRGYKAMISPLLPSACRFSPTCSEYAQEAVARYGAVRGGLKATWRIMRCHPFSAGGFDPVILPEKPAGTPTCACEPVEVPGETRDRRMAGTMVAMHNSSNNLRLNHFWRC